MGIMKVTAMVQVILMRRLPHFTMVNMDGGGVLCGPPPTENGKFGIKTQGIQNISTVIKWGDYPFGNSVNGLQFMANLLLSGLVNAQEWEQIAFSNAETLLGIQ